MITGVAVLGSAVAGCHGPAGSRSGPGKGQPAGTGSSAPATDPGSTDPAARAAAAIAGFSDEDLVGQVLMPIAYGNGATQVSSAAAKNNGDYAGVKTPAE